MSRLIETSVPVSCMATFDKRSTLTQLLSRLADQLAGIGDGIEPAGSSDPALARWADAEYVYLEADLPRGADLEADITVHDGKVFIRLVKT